MQFSNDGIARSSPSALNLTPLHGSFTLFGYLENIPYNFQYSRNNFEPHSFLRTALTKVAAITAVG